LPTVAEGIKTRRMSMALFLSLILYNKICFFIEISSHVFCIKLFYRHRSVIQIALSVVAAPVSHKCFLLHSLNALRNGREIERFCQLENVLQNDAGTGICGI